VKYVYEEVSPTGPFARQAGEYTRYGDVLPLLTASMTASWCLAPETRSHWNLIP